MVQSYNVNGFANFMPSHDEQFDQQTYMNALLLGYSDDEALQLANFGVTDSISCTSTNYHYPDPELFSEPVQKDDISRQANQIATNGPEHHRDLRDSYLNDCNYETPTLTAGIGASHSEAGAGRRQMQEQENRCITAQEHSLIQPNASPSTSAKTTSFRTTPDRDIQLLRTTATLPDTYAGRRSAQGRSRFPRECGACGKRFLYEDSAQKHYRKHHGEPINIISRWDAPKRPPPGIPRNLKSARSRARRSGYLSASDVSTPSVVKSERAYTPTSPSSPSIWTNHSPESLTSNSMSSIASPPARFSGIAGKVINSISNFKTNDIATQVGLQHPILQPAIDPEMSLEPDLANNAPCQSLSRPISERTGLTFSPNDARHAAVRIRQDLREALADTAQEAIARANLHLTSRQVGRSEVVHEMTLVENENEIEENIRWLRYMANHGEYPPLPPDWAYDVGDRSLTWHAEFGKYYRRDVNGNWQWWCENQGRWEEK